MMIIGNLVTKCCQCVMTHITFITTDMIIFPKSILNVIIVHRTQFK